jgi:hypothetical protein
MAADPLNTARNVVPECTADYANVMGGRQTVSAKRRHGRRLRFRPARRDARIEARADLSQLAGA